MQYNFEWDPAKARSNLRKHGVSFDLASKVFGDSMALTIYDEDDSSREEDRWVTLGEINGQHYLVVVHTYRQQQVGDAVAIRLISARHATRHEIAQYQNG